MNTEKTIPSPKQKVIIIGIDGGTWSVIDPLIEKGQLPAFQYLKEHGAWASPKSLDPPLTPIVWTSIASGKDKEKHGILDFFNTSHDVRVKRIWDILEERGYKIGLHEYPVTWPPRECNGFIIPDNFARDDSTHPEDLSFIKELAIGEKNERPIGLRQKLRLVYKAIHFGCSRNTLWRIFKYDLRKRLPFFTFLDNYYMSRMIKLYLYSDLFIKLYNKYKPDFSVTYFNQPDALGHRFWKHMDPEGFDVPKKELKRYKDVVKNSYIAIDKQIQRLMRSIPENSVIVIVSDHGFKKTFTNPYGKALRVRIEDLSNALKISEDIVGVNIHKFTYFRSRKSKPSEREKDRKDLIQKLHLFQQTESGQKIFDIIEDKEWVIVSPISTIDIRPQTPLCTQDGVSYMYGDFIEDTYVEFSGDHDEYGIFIMNGKSIKSNFEIKEASVLDISPTLLSVLGFPVGRDMDGRVMIEAIKDDHLQKHNVQYIDSWDGEEKRKLGPPQHLSAEEEDKLKKRLKDLGYL